MVLSGARALPREVLWARLLLGIALVAVAWGSLVPADRLPDASVVSDKVLHLVGYAVLGGLAVAGQRRPSAWRAMALVLAFGFLMEVLQLTMGYRSFEVGDLVADVVGIATGAGLARLALHRRGAPDA